MIEPHAQVEARFTICFHSREVFICHWRLLVIMWIIAHVSMLLQHQAGIPSGCFQSVKLCYPTHTQVDALAIILFLLHHAKAFIYPLRPEMAHSFHINSGQQTCCRLLQPFYGGRLNLPRRAFCVVGESASVKASITGSGIGAGTKLSEKDSRSQKGHFYGDGDPNHKPSILQNITEQRYSGVSSRTFVHSKKVKYAF